MIGPEPFDVGDEYRREVESLSVDELRVALVREAELRGGWQLCAERLDRAAPWRVSAFGNIAGQSKGDP